MNPTTFDTLTRLLASRRGVLVGGLAILPVLALEGHKSEAAKCKSAGAKCGSHKKCCNGARCRRGRCRCKRGSPKWAGVCCKNRFALASGLGLEPIPGTEFCCPAAGICSQNDNPAQDDCCQENETCIDGKCCCDGCRGTVMCGGVCCGSASCCNGACCPIGQICAETEDGPDCVVGQQDCNIDDDCDPGETCWDGTCCTADRMCVVTVGNDPNVQVCCKASEYCDQALGTCCSNGNICTTGKKVRIRV